MGLVEINAKSRRKRICDKCLTLTYKMCISIKSICCIPLHLYSWDQFLLVGLSKVNRVEDIMGIIRISPHCHINVFISLDK